jgi:hypothetical protein
VLIASIITSTFATSSPSAQVCPNGIVVNLIAYEFPYCLATQGILEHAFLSRPSNTKLVAVRDAGSKSYGSECADINATKGVAHSFFFTADGSDGGSCELITYDQFRLQGRWRSGFRSVLRIRRSM